jgi:hypothetical protein
MLRSALKEWSGGCEEAPSKITVHLVLLFPSPLKQGESFTLVQLEVRSEYRNRFSSVFPSWPGESVDLKYWFLNFFNGVGFLIDWLKLAAFPSNMVSNWARWRDSSFCTWYFGFHWVPSRILEPSIPTRMTLANVVAARPPAGLETRGNAVEMAGQKLIISFWESNLQLVVHRWDVSLASLVNGGGGRKVSGISACRYTKHFRVAPQRWEFRRPSTETLFWGFLPSWIEYLKGFSLKWFVTDLTS